MNGLVFDIQDIIRFKRTKGRLSTENKSCCVISCRIKGESLFFYNGETHLVKKGDVLFIPCGSTYLQECEKEEIVCFHLEAYGNTQDRIKIYTPDNPDEVCGIFINAAEKWYSKTANYRYGCLADLYRIISITGAGLPTEETEVCEIIAPAVNYVNSNMFSETLSLEKACMAAHISRTYFNKVFREIFGCTPITYINKKRIDKAKMLLNSGGYTREEIATLCGFCDVKYFYVVFKKVTGITTMQYIKKS